MKKRKTATKPPATMTVGRVTITDGLITVDGKKVGRVDHKMRHGYHPAVYLQVYKNSEWFELDTPNLLNVIFQRVDSWVKVHNSKDCQTVAEEN